MTSYLDDTWLQAEMQRFEQTKKTLQEAAALLERATTAVPQLQRGLEQLEQHERKTKKNFDQLSKETKQELSTLVSQAQADFDGHVQEVIRKLSAMGEAGQLLELRQEVTKLLAALPVLEQQAAHLTEELSEVQEHYPVRLLGLEDQVKSVQTELSHSMVQVVALHSGQQEHLKRLDHLSGREPQVKASMDALHANQVKLQQEQQQLQTYQQSQGATIQRTVQHLSELDNAGKSRHTELKADLTSLSQQVSEALGRLAQLEARHNAAEFRLEQLEDRVSEQIIASQQQFEAKLQQLHERQQALEHAQESMNQRQMALRDLPEDVSKLGRVLKETRDQFESHRAETTARHDAQRETLAGLERQVGSVQTRASRFIAWFEKASAMTRLRGTPE
ncbi:hypothetical protein D3875_00735 [Deinococcus cavernae]|uniref:Uncharacterized protein n=1 Tax=Deinococcus cavernae TaxID=2320857 RepID=A0A418VHK1_9DEIO|nr:hypothetical protein [Deinococcus cavernae]RJF75608.1 hypothetical protein D3875_00735 [Deinococcus cavernae]